VSTATRTAHRHLAGDCRKSVRADRAGRPAGLCDEHAADLDDIEAYRQAERDFIDPAAGGQS